MDIKILASGSSGNAYYISDGASSLLLDAGIPMKQIQVGIGFKACRLSGVLCTHAHMDHCKALKDFAELGVDVYASKGTLDACGLSGYRYKAAASLQQLQIGTFTVLPFDVQHDAPEPLGFLVSSSVTGEKLLYFTDTYYIKYRFQGLTHIMAECNYSMEVIHESIGSGYMQEDLKKRILSSHMSLEHLLDILQANDLSQVKQIYLLHLSNTNSHADEFKAAVQKATGKEVYIC